ncbi:optic atrophy 3 protein homolog [Lolium rigidum]|uniref:optic atrophy 3 protein homolog n=1 Tax=Lolium rigidum TaxID=89674 RepID=UPI001F5D1527|nr:optic atrophy 3 protein homolog [Lolium rigidum]
MILPLAKLGTLTLKMMAKPVAIRLKTEASRHPKFRQLIINLAQANHRISTNIQRRLYGHSTQVEIRPLNEEKAVQDAADLIGELFVFSVAGAVVVFEVQRSARSENRKEEARKKEVEELKQKEDQLALEIDTLKLRLSHLERLANSQGLSGVLFRRGNGGVADQDKAS